MIHMIGGPCLNVYIITEHGITSTVALQPALQFVHYIVCPLRHKSGPTTDLRNLGKCNVRLVIRFRNPKLFQSTS